MDAHFAHALGHAEARVESFVFGTRLTRTTRLLKSRDPDVADLGRRRSGGGGQRRHPRAQRQDETAGQLAVTVAFMNGWIRQITR